MRENPEKQKELFEMARKKAGITKESLSDEDANDVGKATHRTDWLMRKNLRNLLHLPIM
jgi:hypothetical protein